MVFVPWGFHVKTEHPLIWAEIPMFLTSPWRLTLLFVVSGYASRALIGKMPGIGAFLRQRSGRLLWQLLFGMAVVVPPQTWVELTTQHGYTGGSSEERRVGNGCVSTCRSGGSPCHK